MRLFVLALLLLTGCRSTAPPDVLLLTQLRDEMPRIAQLEVSYGLVFTHQRPNRIISDDYYIREDVARAYYGYPLEEVKIAVHGGLLFVRLPEPRKISVDRRIKRVRITHPNYQPLDHTGTPIDIDAVLTADLEALENRYQQRTLAMTRALSRHYFEALAQRHGLKLVLYRPL